MTLRAQMFERFAQGPRDTVDLGQEILGDDRDSHVWPTSLLPSRETMPMSG
jgi:hypothetical protein